MENNNTEMKGVMVACAWNSNGWQGNASKGDYKNSRFGHVKETESMHESINFGHEIYPAEPDGSFIAFTPSFLRNPPADECQFAFFLSKDYNDKQEKIIGLYGLPQFNRTYYREASSDAFDEFGDENWGNIKSQVSDIIYFEKPINADELIISRALGGKRMAMRGFTYMPHDGCLFLLEEALKHNPQNNKIINLMTKLGIATNANNIQSSKELEVLKLKKQVILQGAPGTGKTYRTASLAVELCDGTCPTDRKELMKRYHELERANRIGFTTFHQSMDYEDFVIGIKSEVTDEGNVSYIPKSGLFKKMCEDASKPVIIKTDDEFPINESARIWKVSLGGKGRPHIHADCMKRNLIRIGWDEFGENASNPTYGVSALRSFINNMEIGDVVFSFYSQEEIDAVGVVTGDYTWDDNLKEFKRCREVKWILKDIRENIYELNGRVNMVQSTVYQLWRISISNVLDILNKHGVNKTDNIRPNTKPYVLIIDEINRGNISKILGELITLLEADKRIKPGQNITDDDSITVKLPYIDMPFGVPDNLYIIGTMNTADRSVGYIDYAIRRRFAFISLKADTQAIEEYYATRNASSDNALVLFGEVAKIINGHLNHDFNKEDLMIGHSYFMAKSGEELNMKLEYEIKPLLREYAQDGLLDIMKTDGQYEVIENLEC